MRRPVGCSVEVAGADVYDDRPCNAIAVSPVKPGAQCPYAARALRLECLMLVPHGSGWVDLHSIWSKLSLP